MEIHMSHHLLVLFLQRTLSQIPAKQWPFSAVPAAWALIPQEENWSRNAPAERFSNPWTMKAVAEKKMIFALLNFTVFFMLQY